MTDRRKLRKCYTFCLDDQVVPRDPLLDEICFKVAPEEIPERYWQPGDSHMAKSNYSPIFAVGGPATVALRWAYGGWKENDLADVAKRQLIATVTYDELFW